MTPESLVKIPGYDYYEYLLVITPHEVLCEKIMKEKRIFAEKFSVAAAYKSLPHITLANFLQLERREKQLVNQLRQIAMSCQQVMVELKDFGSFPSHTIYINIRSQGRLQELIKALRPARKIMTLNKENQPHFISQPHLTIARTLLPWQYEKAWPEYSLRHFTGSFTAQGMMLLGRLVEPLPDGRYFNGKYHVIEKFTFRNMPVATAQGMLF